MTDNQSLTFSVSTEDQISTFLLDHLQPIQMRRHWDNDMKRRFYIQPLIRTYELIGELGAIEHPDDRDVSIKIELYDRIGFETECGYDTMMIQGGDLLIEDDPDSDAPSHDGGADTYWTIAISDIKSIQYIRN